MQIRHHPLSPLLAVVLVLGLASCTGSRRLADLPAERPALFPNHSLAQIRRAVLVGTDTLSAFESRTSLRVDSPDMGGSFSLQVRQRAADSLTVSISMGPGVRVARALVTPDSFFVYDRIKRRLFRNKTSAALESFAVSVTPSDIFQNVLGLVVPPSNQEWHVMADTVFYYVTWPERRESYTVDPRIWRVTRYVRRNESGEVIDDREWSDFDLFGGTYLPRRVKMSNPKEGQFFSLYHRSLELNPAGLDLSFETGRINEVITFPPPQDPKE